MKLARQYGTPICYGIAERHATAPITNLPEGCISVKRKQRSGKAVMAYVRTKDDVQAWVLGPDGDNVKLAILQGVNSRKL